MVSQLHQIGQVHPILIILSVFLLSNNNKVETVAANSINTFWKIRQLDFFDKR